jgi:hypothetical protein
MLRVALFLTCVVTGFSVQPAAQGPSTHVVINEFLYDEGPLDVREFVELHNPSAANVDLSGWSLALHDPNGPSAVRLLPPGSIIQAGGYFVLGTAAVPGVDLVLGQANVLPDGPQLMELVDLGGVVVDSVAYEAARPLWPGRRTEGSPIFGEHISGSVRQSSQSRLRDGLDTQDNANDFRVAPATPGRSNNLPAPWPLRDTFDGGQIGTPARWWAGSKQDPVVVDPATIQGVGPSPQGRLALSLLPPQGTRGQSYTLLADAGDGFVLDAWVYLDAAPVAAGEVFTFTLGIRGSTGSEYRAPDPGRITGADENGDRGLCWTYRLDSRGAALYLVDNRAGGRDHVVLERIPITRGLNDGWQRLRLSSAGEEAAARFGGTPGNYDGTLYQTPVLASAGGVFAGIHNAVASRAVQALLDGVETDVEIAYLVNGASGCQGNCPPRNPKTKNINTKKTTSPVVGLPEGDYAFYVDPGGPILLDAVCFLTAQVSLAPVTMSTEIRADVGGTPGALLVGPATLVDPAGTGWEWWYAMTPLSTSSPFWVVLRADGTLFLPIAENGPSTVLVPSSYRPDAVTSWSATPSDERWVYQLVCSDTVGDMDGDFIGETAPGTMFRMRMTGGSSGSFGFVVLGTGLQFPPLDLTGYGAPGCAVFPLTQTKGLVLTDALGSATFPLAVPAAPVFSGMDIYSQWLVPDASANRLGLASSWWASARIR